MCSVKFVNCLQSLLIFILSNFRISKINFDTFFKYIINHLISSDSRETGFVNAIMAAGITYEITRACTAGQLVQCSCDKAKGGGGGGGPMAKHLNSASLPPGDWQWGGCGDNIRYGYRTSRYFMDSIYKKLIDIKTLIKLHNHNAGRLVSRYSFIILHKYLYV